MLKTTKIKMVILIIAVFFSFGNSFAVKTRLKDMARLKSVRGNQLIGYGIVVGLNGTGDKDQTKFTNQSLANALSKMGMEVNPTAIKVKNVAAVMVVAELPPFARNGDKIDVIVSSIGDAKSLQGGTLILTPLKGPDGVVYAVAQGPVSIGGISAGGGGTGVTVNHPNVGRVPSGAVIEREIKFDFGKKGMLTYSLIDGDFKTAKSVADAINKKIGEKIAYARDLKTVDVKIPDSLLADPVSFVAMIEDVPVETENEAVIVVNERTGTVVVGSDVKIDKVAISHGNLTISITSTPLVSQPNALSNGETVQANQTAVNVTEETRRLIELDEGVSLGVVVKSLNKLGVTPRDLISILQALKEAGALKAKLKLI